MLQWMFAAPPNHPALRAAAAAVAAATRSSQVHDALAFFRFF